MYPSDREIAIYKWIDACPDPERTFSIKEKDGTIVIVIKPMNDNDS